MLLFHNQLEKVLQKSDCNLNLDLISSVFLKFFSRTHNTHVRNFCSVWRGSMILPLFFVLVVQLRGCGTCFLRRTGSGHRWCGWDWWMTWRDRSGWLVGSTSELFNPKRIVTSCIAGQDCFRTAIKLYINIFRPDCFNLKRIQMASGEVFCLGAWAQSCFG